MQQAPTHNSTVSQAHCTWDAQSMLQTVEASPAAVARHDRAAWLGLFSAAATVEDPVGTPSNRVVDGTLEGFYDTFIAPNDIRFHVAADYICGNTVARDVRIETRMASGAKIVVPAHLLYELQADGDGLKIRYLAAHWELRKMVPLVIFQGWRGLRTMFDLSVRMLKYRGISGAVGYSQGFYRGIFQQGKLDAAQFVLACNGNDSISALFHTDFPGVEFPSGTSPIGIEQVREKLSFPMCLHATIASGFHVTFKYTLGVAELSQAGLGLLEYDPETRKIRRARLFL